MDHFQYDKKNPVLRTKEQRQQEVRIIIRNLTELELTTSYEPIKELMVILKEYVNDGGKKKISIPFPMIQRRIKGVLSDTINEECFVRLINEN